MIDVEAVRSIKRKKRIWPFGPVKVYDASVRPRLYVQFSLPGAGQLVNLSSGKITNTDGNQIFIPPNCDRFNVNVEAGSLRYIDDGNTPIVGYGELWPAIANYFRIVDPHMVQLCSEVVSTKFSISFYSSTSD